MGLHRKKTFEDLKVVLNNAQSDKVDISVEQLELALQLAYEQQCVIEKMGKKIKNLRNNLKGVQRLYDLNRASDHSFVQHYRNGYETTYRKLIDLEKAIIKFVDKETKEKIIRDAYVIANKSPLE